LFLILKGRRVAFELSKFFNIFFAPCEDGSLKITDPYNICKDTGSSNFRTRTCTFDDHGLVGVTFGVK
jgi:hypothetical protein